MVFRLTALRDLTDTVFDDIIDARSPAEFAEDRLPGAINLPVLDNDARARVGTMYVQESRFGARKLGAALVLRSIARHLETALADRPGGWRPLVYCWRGGQRSGTFAWLLGEIGWRAEALEGGYRSYRRLVVRDLYDRPLPHRLVVLDGMTCTAKTALLNGLGQGGTQVLDLEEMAAHRGSVFGATAVRQPRQKAFESRIAMALAGMDPRFPLVVEAESSKVGDLSLPPRLWSAMRAAPRIEIRAPILARARYFPEAYPDLVADPAAFCARIEKLRPLCGGAQVETWQAMVREGAVEAVAAELMTRHYDPRYAKSVARHARAPGARLTLDSLAPEARGAALPELAALVEAASRRAVPVSGIAAAAGRA